jgi:hypothetical protein
VYRFPQPPLEKEPEPGDDYQILGFSISKDGEFINYIGFCDDPILIGNLPSHWGLCIKPLIK